VAQPVHQHAIRRDPAKARLQFGAGEWIVHALLNDDVGGIAHQFG